jgi:hypothetical protein
MKIHTYLIGMFDGAREYESEVNLLRKVVADFVGNLL